MTAGPSLSHLKTCQTEHSMKSVKAWPNCNLRATEFGCVRFKQPVNRNAKLGPDVCKTDVSVVNVGSGDGCCELCDLAMVPVAVIIASRSSHWPGATHLSRLGDANSRLDHLRWEFAESARCSRFNTGRGNPDCLNSLQVTMSCNCKEPVGACKDRLEVPQPASPGSPSRCRTPAYPSPKSERRFIRTLGPGYYPRVRLSNIIRRVIFLPVWLYGHMASSILCRLDRQSLAQTPLHSRLVLERHRVVR